MLDLSRVVRKPTSCICENKDADQLRGNREADQRLCFRYIDGTIYPLPIYMYEISSLWPSSMAVQPGLCGTWSETPKTGFLRTRLMLDLIQDTSSLLMCIDTLSCKITGFFQRFIYILVLQNRIMRKTAFCILCENKGAD